MKRLASVFAVGIVAATLAAYHLSPYWGAHDFGWPLQAARLLLAGQNPYRVPLFPMRDAVFSDPLFYPLPAVLIALPFTPLPDPMAGALWSALSAGLLACVVPPHRWPLFCSAMFVVNTQACTWVMLLMAVVEVPALSGVLVCKPTIGAVLWLSRPQRAGVIGGIALILLSLIMLPTWPLDWLTNIRRTHHPIPLLVFPPLVLLVLRWRDRDARFVVSLALVPQILHLAEPLLLFRACRRWHEAAILALVSWPVYVLLSIVQPSGVNYPFVVPALYGTMMVLLFLRQLVNSDVVIRSVADQIDRAA